MASITGRSGKCSNFGNCSIADTRVQVEVPTGLDLVCSECGKPLLTLGNSPEGNRSKLPLIMAVLAVAVALIGGAAWKLVKGDSESPKNSPSATTQPTTGGSGTKPANGNCSANDERVGLCKISN